MDGSQVSSGSRSWFVFLPGPTGVREVHPTFIAHQGQASSQMCRLVQGDTHTNTCWSLLFPPLRVPQTLPQHTEVSSRLFFQSQGCKAGSAALGVPEDAVEAEQDRWLCPHPPQMAGVELQKTEGDQNGGEFCSECRSCSNLTLLC